MDATRYALLIAHLIGMAAILGPWLGQLSSAARGVTQTMVWGARVQIVTGLLLVAVAMVDDHELDHVKIAVKLVVALAIAGLAEAGAKRHLDAGAGDRGPAGAAWWLIGILTIVNIAVAVVWG